jgi:hypothetical protein
VVYSHRQANEIPAKTIEFNLRAKSLKPWNSKTSPMTPDFLYNFLTLLQSRN